MKSMSTFLAALLCATSPVLAQEVTVQEKTTQFAQSPTSLQLGYDAIAQIRSDYVDGKYTSFLEEMDGSYAAALSENQLSSLVEMRQNALETHSSAEAMKLQEIGQQLHKERDAELLQIVSQAQADVFVDKVHSVTAQFVTPEQKKAIEQIVSYRHMVPGTGKNTDENRLIDLDLEYEYKNLHLQAVGGSDLMAKRMVLKMQHLDRMQEAAKDFTDTSLQSAVSLFSRHFDERLAQIWDANDLNALGKGQLLAQNETEEKLAKILSSYQEKAVKLPVTHAISSR